MRVYILFFSLILFSCNTKEIVQEIELLSSFDNEYIYFDLNVTRRKRKNFCLIPTQVVTLFSLKKGEETELKPIRKNWGKWEGRSGCKHRFLEIRNRKFL